MARVAPTIHVDVENRQLVLYGRSSRSPWPLWPPVAQVALETTAEHEVVVASSAVTEEAAASPVAAVLVGLVANPAVVVGSAVAMPAAVVVELVANPAAAEV